MRRLGTCAGIVLTAAVIGCGEGKKLPDEVVKPQTTRSVPPDPLGKAPAASEPEAKAVLDRAVKAITQGDPSRLAKARVARSEFRGTMLIKTRAEAALSLEEAGLSWEVVWPDRAVVVYSFKEALAPPKTFRLRGPEGWMFNGTEKQPESPTDMGQVVAAGVCGQHGVSLGLPLADARGVAFEMRKSQPGSRAVTSVKLAIPDMPILLIAFDDSSGLPVGLEYHPLEIGNRPRKVVTFADHKPHGDLLLPTRLEVNQNGMLVEKWTLEKWEFPEKIDDAKFDAPK
jgi:hypothetical protein